MKKTLLILLLISSTLLGNGERKYALVKNGEIDTSRNPTGVETFKSDWDPASVAHKFDFRPFIETEKPEYNSDTHTLQWTARVESDAVYADWIAVELSQREKDNRRYIKQRSSIKRAAYFRLKDLGFTDDEIRGLAELLADDAGIKQ